MSNQFERTLFEMAKKEKMVLPNNFNDRIDGLLKELPRKRKTRKISVRAACILAAALTLSISATAFAALSLQQQRMEAMNKEKLEEYFVTSYKGGESDTKNRSFSETEQRRMEVLNQSYEVEGLFPQGALLIIENSNAYKGKGVAFLPQRSAFFLPDHEMTDEELLQIIDFNHKRDYSLTKVNEMIDSGAMTFPDIEKETVTPTDKSIISSGAAKNSTQELTIPYTGNLEITTIQAGNNDIFLAGWDGIHRMTIGSSHSELFFKDFGDFDIRIDSMAQAKDGTLYAGLRKYDKNGFFLSLEVWSFDTHGAVQKKLDISQHLTANADTETSTNVIKHMAVDERGYLYLRTMGEDILTVFDTDGNLISHVKNSQYTSHLQAGIGIGKDGLAYTYIRNKNSDDSGIASVNPVNGTLDQIYIGILPAQVLPLDIIAKGIDTDFIFWGYEGIFSYSIGDKEAKQIMPPYKSPCQWENSLNTALPDGRIVFGVSSDYNEVTDANGKAQFRRKPESTTFFYSVTAEK